MAKTSGPLLSFEADGQVGKTVVFSKWRGVKYARRHVVPANPRTVEQTKTRSTFAMLREIWKLMPSVGREPWDAFATGRPFLGLNAFIGENMRVIRGQGDLLLFRGSPGARGGLPPEDIVAMATANPGEVEVTFSNPAAPDGWTLEASVAMAFQDHDPVTDVIPPIVVAEETGGTGIVTLSGLTEGQTQIVLGWLRWSKPNGQKAYSVSLNDSAVTV